MSRFLRNGAIVLGLLGVSGCGDSTLLVDIQYATRCETTLGCAAPTDHDICGFHQSTPCTEGEPQVLASCSVEEGDNDRTFSFSALQETGSSIGISGMTIPIGGTTVSGASCRVTVHEGPNTYVGGCGASAPNAAQPCQISGMMFEQDAEGRPTFEGHVFCQGLENEAQPSLTIEVTEIGPGPEHAATPARFAFGNCTGFRL